MKFKVFSLFFGITTSSLFSAAYGQTDPCSTLADLQNKTQKDLFVGYATGASQKEADQNAQIDLARHIRQKVSATSTVDESTNSVSLNASSKSVVSEVLIGAKILKRCNIKDSFSTVITLEKTAFIVSLEEKLSNNLKKGNKLIQSIENARDDEVLGRNIEAAKKFLADYQITTEDDLNVCKVYSGCNDTFYTADVFADLAEVVAKEGDKDQYIFLSAKDKVSQFLKNDLITLLEEDEKDRVKIMEKSVAKGSEFKRKILANCKAKVGSKIPDTDDRIVETRCIVEAYIGKQKKFRKVYSCKSTMDDDIAIEDAVAACSGRLTLE